MLEYYPRRCDLFYRLTHRGRSRRRDHWRKGRKERNQINLREQRKVLSQRPPPLPVFPQNISESSLCIQASAESQPQSLLCSSLPIEIRLQIWSLVLSEHLICVTHIDRAIRTTIYPINDGTRNAHATAPMDYFRPLDLRFLLSLPAANPELSVCHASYYSQSNNDRPIPYLLERPRPIGWDNEEDLLPRCGQFYHDPFRILSLPLTCHAIYAEALPLLYRTNSFSFSSPLPLLYLYDLPLVPQHHLCTWLQRLQFHWVYYADYQVTEGHAHGNYAPTTWPRFWAIVSKDLKNLRWLGCHIELVLPPWLCQSLDDEWVRPMLWVKGLERAKCRIERREGPSMWQWLVRLSQKIEEVWLSEEENT